MALRLTNKLTSPTTRFLTRPTTNPLITSTHNIRTRTMATEARKHEFLIVVPDFPGTREKRLSVRPKHFEGLKPLTDSGFLKMGGAVLNDVPKDDEVSSLDFAGSTLIAVGSSEEEILAVLRKDIYAESGVWDLEKAQMWPLKLAFRHAL